MPSTRPNTNELYTNNIHNNFVNKKNSVFNKCSALTLIKKTSHNNFLIITFVQKRLLLLDFQTNHLVFFYASLGYVIQIP